MKPETVANEVGRLVKRLSRASKLPADWRPADVVNLIGEYRGLIETLDSEATGKASADIYQHGIRGSYEAMEHRARMADPVARQAMKRGKSK